jgi:hypothetical protein
MGSRAASNSWLAQQACEDSHGELSRYSIWSFAIVDRRVSYSIFYLSSISTTLLQFLTHSLMLCHRAQNSAYTCLPRLYHLSSNPQAHFRAILNPLVMKSALFPLPGLCSLLLNRPATFSFCAIFLLLFLSSCSSSTFRVSEAVALFLRPLLADVSFFSFFSAFAVLSSSDDKGLVAPFEAGMVASVVMDASACFLFLSFLLPGAFLSACVSPFSLSVLIRRFRRAMSVDTVGRMGITSFSAYVSLHCLLVSPILYTLLPP